MARTFSRLASGLNADFARELMHPTLVRDYERFFRHFMAINRAHVVMLAERRILETSDAATILRGLAEVEQELTPETLREDLDLYFNVERALAERIGSAAGRMHTARSRNDLQAGYQRLAVRDALRSLAEDILALRSTLLHLAEQHTHTIMPGYTHGQPAQPITFGHYLLAVHDAFARDWQRIVLAWQRTNRSPLGAGALATTGFPIDRQCVAELLGFDGLIENSLDAVASRDYLLEALAACVGAASTASRISADLITWSAWEYRYVEVADGYASGSSIMPQKKNPLALEHTRAKLAHVLAAYTSVATLTKGLPFTHSRDTGSEAFQLAFEGFAQVGLTARVLKAVLDSLVVHRERMAAAAEQGYATATELADTLVRRCGLPFRTAHDIVGALVARSIQEDRSVREWTLDDVRLVAAAHGADISELTPDDLREALEASRNVAARAVEGGPAPDEVRRMLAARRDALARDQTHLATLCERTARAEQQLMARVGELLRTGEHRSSTQGSPVQRAQTTTARTGQPQSHEPQGRR